MANPILWLLDWIGRLQTAYWLWGLLGGTAAMTAALAFFHGSALDAFLAFLAGTAIVLLSIVIATGMATKRKHLIIIPHRQRNFWWHMGSMGSQPVMQIVGDFYITNPDMGGVFITKSRIVIYYLKWRVLPWRKSGDGMIVTPDEISSHATMEVRADFYLMPPCKKIGAPLRGRVCFLDQRAREHWTGLLKWEHDSKLATQI